MNGIAEFFRKREGDETAELKPGVYVHVQNGLEIRIKAIDRSRITRWFVTVESRVTTGRQASPWTEVNLSVGDVTSYSFDYVPERTR